MTKERKSKMNIIKRIAMILAACLILVSAFPIGALARQTSYPTPEGYDDHDYQKFRSFLTQPDIDSLGWDPNDPTDWWYVGWTETAPRKITYIDLEPLYLEEPIKFRGELDVSDFTALEYLNVSYNKLTKLDVSGCTALKDLGFGYCGLTSVNLSGCTALKSLYCAYNSLETLDVSDITTLTRLHCSGNDLAILDISNLTQLGYLNCDKNYLNLSRMTQQVDDLRNAGASIVQATLSPQKDNPVVLLNPANQPLVETTIVVGWKILVQVTVAPSTRLSSMKIYDENKREVDADAVDDVNQGNSRIITLQMWANTLGEEKVFSVYNNHGLVAKFVLTIVPLVTDPKILNINAPESAYKDRAFRVDIVSSRKISDLVIKNESNKNVGHSIVGKTTNPDGSISTTIEMSVSTVGMSRMFSICEGGYVIGQFTIDIIDPSLIELQLLRVNAPQSAVKDQVFQVEIVSTQEIPNLIIRNESNGWVGYVTVGKTENADGSVTTVVELSVGTIRMGRVLSICDSDRVLGQFGIDVLSFDPSNLSILRIDAPQSAIKNRSFRFTIVSSQKIPSLVIRNENGGKMGVTIVSQSTNTDGSVSTVMEMSVGTAQAGRVFKIFNNETQLGSFTIDITEPPLPMGVLSVTAPKSVARNFAFFVTIVSTEDFQKLSIRNELGGKIGCIVQSKTRNADFSYTTVIKLSLGSIGNGRVLSIYDGETSLRTFTLNVVK